MISSIIDGVLLCALAATSVCVLLMYRRLQKFDALQGEAATAFARTAHALDNAKAAMDTLNADSGEMAVSLAARLNEARMLLNELDRVTGERRRPAHAEVLEDPKSPPPSPRDAQAEFLAEWEERFTGMRAAAEARAQAAHTTQTQQAATMNALVTTQPTRTALALSPAPSLTVSWRALSDAAHRTA